MRSFTLSGSSLLFAGLAAAPATASSISITIPQPKVSEYRKPYVAVWLEPASGGAARTLSIWYDTKKGGAEGGTKYLADLRSWWRKGGRTLSLPADGVSGATRAPGTYQVTLPADIAAGQYVLHVEAAREQGGREVVSLPIAFPAATASGAGKAELGAITVSPR